MELMWDFIQVIDARIVSTAPFLLLLVVTWDLVIPHERYPYFPAPAEWPATGLNEAREPRNVRELLLMPLTRRVTP